MAAYQHGSWVDRLVMGFSVVGFSVPVFVLGYLLIYVFAIQIKLFPVQGYRSILYGFWPFLYRLILPIITLSVIYIALIARITRASVLEVLGEDYIRTAHAKGLPEPRRADAPRAAQRRGADRHGDRHRRGAPDRRRRGDRERLQHPGPRPAHGRCRARPRLPTIQAVILLFSFVYVLINLVIDLAYTLLDPRIRY